ncbi:MAG: AraC family transcriptional regulator ligand-binding domain-containing protein [Roseobacter sp.]|nr:AraC family transcriptional regulator ligand-binding domain-containing protein [Roseobacter sp.]
MTKEMVNAIEFSHVVDLLDRIASPRLVDRALRASGLSRKAVKQTSGYVPYRLEASVIEYVARATGDTQLGAKLGQQFNYAAYDAYARYVLNAHDLKTAITRGREAFAFINPGSEIHLDFRGDIMVAGRTSGLDSAVGHRHLDDGAIVLIAKVFKHFLGPNWRPEWVEICGADTKRAAFLEDLMDAPLQTEARMPGVAIRIEDLSTKNPSPPAPNEVISLAELPSMMGIRPASTTRDLVWHTLTIQLVLGSMTQEAVAQKLNIGPRTLQRALQQEGTSFRDVKASFIESRARLLLSKTDFEIPKIARSLGYDEPKSFQRAFRKQTGMTPRAYRTVTAHG